MWVLLLWFMSSYVKEKGFFLPFRIRFQQTKDFNFLVVLLDTFSLVEYSLINVRRGCLLCKKLINPSTKSPSWQCAGYLLSLPFMNAEWNRAWCGCAGMRCAATNRLDTFHDIEYPSFINGTYTNNWRQFDMQMTSLSLKKFTSQALVTYLIF